MQAAATGDESARLLLLLHDADRLLSSSFVGEFRDWALPLPNNTLVLEPDEPGAGDQPRAGRLRWAGAGPFPRAVETRRRIWFDPPDRLRVEMAQDGRLLRLGVRNRESWWRWSLAHGADAGAVVGPDGTLRLPPLLDPPLLSPAGLIARFRFEPDGIGRVLDREVLCSHARLRRGLPQAQKWSFRFEFDAQYGTMLRCARFEDERRVELTEAVAARFGVPIDAARFVFVQPDTRAAT